MSTGFQTLAKEDFRLQIEKDFQGTGMLKGTTREIHGIKGLSYQIPVGEPLVMQDLVTRCSEIPTQDVNYRKPKLPLNDKVIKVCTDIFTKAEVGFSEVPFLVEDFKDSIGRQEDQIKIDALEASAASLIANGGTNMIVAKLIEAGTKLDDLSVPQGNRHMALSGSQARKLLGEDKFTNSDFATRALMHGSVTREPYMGFIFHIIGADRDALEGGLPLTGDIRTCFAWHERAVWSGWGIDPKLNIVDKPENANEIVIAIMRLGAISTLDNGIVKIDCDQTDV